LYRARGFEIHRQRTGRRRHDVGDRRRDRSRTHRRLAGDEWSLIELSARFRVAPNAPEGRATAEGRILIVDDESSIRLVCRVNLASAGFETLEAPDGETALSVARAERPDLILLDIMLPGVDGWEVAKKLAAAPETREIPVVFLTARSAAADQARAHAAGGVGYIAKPFDPNELAARIRDLLERIRRGERESLRREWQESLES
jgi:PleD family two-component response regulator